MATGVPSLPLDTLVAQRFLIQVDGTNIASFQEVSGITSEIEVVELKANDALGKPILKKMIGATKPPTITLKRAADSSMDLWNWHYAMYQGNVSEALRLRIGDVYHQVDVSTYELTADAGSSFATALDGIRAMFINLLAYHTEHGINTLAEIFDRWAPSNDPNANNDPTANCDLSTGTPLLTANDVSVWGAFTLAVPPLMVMTVVLKALLAQSYMVQPKISRLLFSAGAAAAIGRSNR